MPRVSVIIPTHNRLDLVREALASVRDQTVQDWEIVVIDDGSEPPVDADSLRSQFGPRIRILRNDTPRTQPYARDQGVQAASGEVVIHLDDDDLLAPDALEKGLSILESDDRLELVYLGVKGFGRNAIAFDNGQARAMRRVLAEADGTNFHDDVVRFSRKLFAALLNAVPMAFQRSMEYRTTWNKVSDLRRRVYLLDPDIADAEAAMRRLKPPLRESEWALYAAACCNTALCPQPLYLQRCERQGYFSISAQREQAALSNIDIKANLYRATSAIEDLRAWRSEIRGALAAAYFDQAFFFFEAGRRLNAFQALSSALRTRPAVSHLRLGLRMLLPRGFSSS